MMFRNDFPLSPRKLPFFYGWVILAAGTVGTLSSIPGQTMGVSAFTDHLLAALELSRTQLSLAYMAGTLCSGLLIVRAGRWLDRFGVRKMVVAASLCLGLSLLGMAGAGEILRAAVSAAGSRVQFAAAMAISFSGFFFIRFFGQGMLSIIPRVMIGKWFERRRGLAAGISGVFVSFGFSSSPLLFGLLIGRFGWQGAYVVLAVAVGLGMGLIGWIFYRERPEDFGLVRDGGDAGPEKRTVRFPVHREYTLEEARRTFAFWIFTLGLATQGLVGTAMTFHIVSISETAGLRAEQGLALFLPMSVISVTTNFCAGWLSDRTRLKYFLLTLLFAQIFGSIGLLLLNTTMGKAMAVAGFAVAGGLFGTLIIVTWPRFFGTAHLGAITGLNMAVMVFASAFGPILFGFFFEQSGSYAPGIVACIVLTATILVGGIWADNPQEKAV